MADRGNDAGWWIQIGGAVSDLPLLDRVHAAGVPILLIDAAPEPVGASLASRTLLRSPSDLDGIRDAVRATSSDARIVGCATGQDEPDAHRVVAAIRGDHDLPGRDRERLEAFLVRSAWKKILADAGIATPESAILESPLELDRFLGAHPSALLRPATGGRGSAGVSRARIGDPRNREFFDEARLVSDSDLVRAEAFVPGEAHVVEGYVRKGRFVPLVIGRKFAMRHLRGTLPTGIAWGTARAGEPARESERWAEFEALTQRVSEALGGDDGLLSLDLLHDGDTCHVIDVRPHLGRAVERGLAFAGQDPVGLAFALATGRDFAEPVDAGGVTRGFAQRFCYASANGPILDPRPDAAPRPPSGEGADRWDKRPLDDARVEFVLDRDFGALVERPTRPEDRVASVLVEAADRNAAWMRANETDPDTLFRVDEPKPEPRQTVPPIWPMAPGQR